MEWDQVLRTTTAFALAMGIGVISCAGGQAKEPTTASDVSGDNDTAADEEEMMADLDNYLEEEGEDVGGDGAEDSGEDAAEGDLNPARETPKERTDEIYALIKSKRDNVAECYKAARKANPKIGTRIAVTIVIKADGTLKSDPVIEEGRSDISDESVRKCTIDVVKSIVYPAHPKGMETTFTYPFGF